MLDFLFLFKSVCTLQVMTPGNAEIFFFQGKSHFRAPNLTRCWRVFFCAPCAWLIILLSCIFACLTKCWRGYKYLWMVSSVCLNVRSIWALSRKLPSAFIRVGARCSDMDKLQLPSIGWVESFFSDFLFRSFSRFRELWPEGILFFFTLYVESKGKRFSRAYLEIRSRFHVGSLLRNHQICCWYNEWESQIEFVSIAYKIEVSSENYDYLLKSF